MTSIKDDPEFVPVHVHTLNPKSITQGQLYGNFDENTHEWTDGVLPIIYRNCSKDTSPDRHWIVFDGPVDAVWIEVCVVCVRVVFPCSFPPARF
jgi:dynein heavy chain